MKIKQLFLTAAFAAVFVFPQSGLAITADEIQAQITALQAQIAALQQQLTQMQGGTAQWCHTFNTNLKVGDTGNEVVALIEALRRENLVAPVAGGEEFGEGLASAVSGFQEKYKDEILTPLGLKYGTGYVGKSTRAKLNQLYGCSQPPVPVPTQGTLSIQPSNFSVQVGKSQQVQAMYQEPLPPCATSQSGSPRCLPEQKAPYPVNAQLFSSNPNVAQVEHNVGVCTGDSCENINAVDGISPGTAEITASYYPAAKAAGQVVTAKTTVTVTATPAVQSSIKVLYPNGGETLTLDHPDPYTIKWSVSSDITSVSIYLYKNDASYKAIVTNLPVNYKGGYLWNPASTLTSADIGYGVYKIYMIGYKSSGGTVEDKSDAAFSIISTVTTQSSIQVLSPNGGENWAIGSVQTIRWAASGSNLPSVWIGFAPVVNQVPCAVGAPCAGPPPYEVIAANVPATAGAYQWTVPQREIGPYRIQVSLGESGKISDKSDAPFSIVAAGTPQSITLTAPNGGEQWQIGNDHTILWTPYSPDGTANPTNPASQVTAYLEKLVNGSFVTVGKIIPAGKASIHWIGEIDKYGNYAEPGNYYIKVVNNTTGASDRSDQPFTLVAQNTIKAVLKVNGSENDVKLASGVSYTVSWASSNAASCELYYPSAPDGVGAVLNLSTAGDKNLVAPNNIPADGYYLTLNCKGGSIEGYGYDSVKIYPLTNVTQPLIQVLSPNGGEVWHPGETHRISWSSTGVNSVKIYIYDPTIYGSGSTLYVTPNNNPVSASQGYFDWTIGPFGTVNGAPGSGGSNYRIRIDDAAGVVSSDSSDTPFSIVAGAAAVNVSLDPSSPSSHSIDPNAANVLFTAIRLTNPNNTDAQVNGVTITPSDTNGERFLANIRLMDGSVQLGPTVISSPGNGTTININLTLVANSSKVIGVYADLRDYPTSGTQLRLGVLPKLGPASSITLNDIRGPVIYGSYMTVVGTTSPSLSVIAPNNGDVLTLGQSFTLRWTNTTGLSTFIDFLKGGTQVMTFGPSPSSMSSFSWTVQSLAAGSDYTAQLRTADNTQFVKSTGYFSIVAGTSQPAITYVSLDPSTPPSTTVTPGQTNVTFAKIRLTAGSSDVSNINSIQVGSDSTNAWNYFNNIKVFDDVSGVQIGNAITQLALIGNYYQNGVSVSGFVIAANVSRVLSLRADIPAGAPIGTSVHLGIVQLMCGSSGACNTQGLPVFGNAMTVQSATAYPGFTMSTDKSSYLPTETATLKLSRADGRNEPYAVDVYSLKLGGDRNNAVLIQGNVLASLNTAVSIPLNTTPFFVQSGAGTYYLFACKAGCAIGTEPSVNSIFFSISPPSASAANPNVASVLDAIQAQLNRIAEQVKSLQP